MARTPRNQDPRSGKLFYAVILSATECDMGNIGLDGKRVHSLNHRDLGALVSDYPQVASIKLLRKNLAPYYRVLREASECFTVVPARFGQIAKDPAEVKLALRRNYGRVQREVARLDGKVEMALRIRWRSNDVFPWLLEHDAELRAHRDRTLAEAGSVDRLTAIDFGRYVQDRMNRIRRRVTETALAHLPEAEVRLDDIVEERMVANAALLVKKELRPELETAVARLGETLSDAYAVTLEGPWPPFSFVGRIELDLLHA